MNIKKLLFTAFTAGLLLACQSEEFSIITSINDTNSLFFQTPESELDESKEGLYHGLFNSFDTSIKGEIVISLGNNGRYEAEVLLVNGKSIYFGTNTIRTENVLFVNARGSFELTIKDNNILEVDDFLFDRKPCYIRAYKKLRGVDVSVALGTYTETANASFMGNWDLLNLGSQVIPEGLPSGTALGIDRVIISSPSNTVFEDSNLIKEVPPLCIDYPAPIAYVADVFGDGEDQILEAQSQVSTFGGMDCFWGISVGASFNTVIGDYYDDDCQVTTSGTWSWNGKTGSISALSVGLPPTAIVQLNQQN